jgi:hypothetical protein
MEAGARGRGAWGGLPVEAGEGQAGGRGMAESVSKAVASAGEDG